LLLPLSVIAYWPTSVDSQEVSGSEQIIINEVAPALTIEEMVRAATSKYGVSFSEVWYTIGCETGGTYDPTIQSDVKYNFNDARRGIVYGDRERSYGLAQIHLPDHPSVTYDMATDPEYAIDFIASNWSKHSGWWYSWVNKACGPI
jgi:hypothetical protein